MATDWHLDKRVNLSVICAIVFQTAVALEYYYEIVQ